MGTKTKLILSAVLAAGLLLFSYWVTNLRYPISGEKAVLYKFELIRNYFSPQEETMSDSVLMVNVSFDKQSVVATDEYGFPVGQTQITDRKKLLSLLQYLKERGDYKYILMDVFFGENGARTEVDSALFSTILSMPRIVIPRHSDERLVDERLYEKAGLADYVTTYKEGSFVKYPYLMDSVKSMPVRMYEELTGKHIEQHGIFYTDGNKLARSCIVLTFELICQGAYNDEGEKTWYNLGMDLLGDSIDEYAIGDSLLYIIPELTRGKYIVIGAYQDEDIHGNYLRAQPGVCINFNAYLALQHGHHCISMILYLILFTAFFVLFYLMLSQQTLKDLILQSKTSSKAPVRWTRRGLLVLCSWIGFSLFLSILCIITYLWLGEAYDIFITATLLGLMNKVVQIIIKQKDKLWAIKEKFSGWL